MIILKLNIFQNEYDLFFFYFYFFKFENYFQPPFENCHFSPRITLYLGMCWMGFLVFTNKKRHPIFQTFNIFKSIFFLIAI